MDNEGRNLRYCFGPLPGREWWTCDAKNIELRIPAYEAEEEEMIAIFDKPNDPPYFGSYHLLVFDTLHPKLFAKHGAECKDLFADTWYQWVKNGNFAVNYGSVEESGTADRSYHVNGAFRRLKGRFSKIHGPNGLNAQMIRMAERLGYVETIPDKTVDSKRGYPLFCKRNNWGRIKPTVPLNYHVQGTACWWMMKAMIRCYEFLERLNRRDSTLPKRFLRIPGVEDRLGYYIVIQVHDELGFDFPLGETPQENLPIVQECMRLMEEGGNDIDVPTPVSCSYHPDDWSKHEKIAE